MEVLSGEIENEAHAIEIMKQVAAPEDGWDYEKAHKSADAVVSAALRAAGWNALADEYDKHRPHFWYA